MTTGRESRSRAAPPLAADSLGCRVRCCAVCSPAPSSSAKRKERGVEHGVSTQTTRTTHTTGAAGNRLAFADVSVCLCLWLSSWHECSWQTPSAPAARRRLSEAWPGDCAASLLGSWHGCAACGLAPEAASRAAAAAAAPAAEAPVLAQQGTAPAPVRKHERSSRRYCRRVAGMPGVSGCRNGRDW